MHKDYFWSQKIGNHLNVNWGMVNHSIVYSHQKEAHSHMLNKKDGWDTWDCEVYFILHSQYKEKLPSLST